MCGFAGFIEFPNHNLDMEHTIGLMLLFTGDLMILEPWVDVEAGIALGHRRLSVVDLSRTGHQPMYSTCGRFIITLNGEIYGYELLRSELEADGWRGHSDTEILLAAITLYGVEKALEKCVGIFAFALWNRVERTLIMARDRLGEKPLYYGWLGRTFVFTSDLAALYKHPKFNGEINRNALGLLMRHNYIPAPYSIFLNISKLPPGHLLTLPLATGKPTITTYYSIAAVTEQAQLEPFKGTKEEAVDQLEILLRQSLAGQMVADVPLGAFLSGGIDSSTVVAFMQSMSSSPVRSFTIGFNEKSYNEAEHARAVANHLGTEHTELYVDSRDALDVIPNLPKIYSEPFSDSSQIPTGLGKHNKTNKLADWEQKHSWTDVRQALAGKEWSCSARYAWEW